MPMIQPERKWLYPLVRQARAMVQRGELGDIRIVLPGLSVTAANVAEAYQTVGGEPASPALMAAAGD